MKLKDYLLGGPTTPMAGDGIGLVVRPLASPSPNLPPVSFPDYFGKVRSQDSSSSTSRNPSPQPHRHALSELPSANSQRILRQKTVRRPTDSPNGIRAPLSSLATLNAATIKSPDSPRASEESYHTCVQESPANEIPGYIEETPWQDYEIPQELETVNNDTPREVRNIIQESMDEHRAMRVSRLQAQANFVRTAIETSGTLCRNNRPALAESSATASARSTPCSEYTDERSDSSLSISHESTTSLGSDMDDGAFLQPLKLPGRSLANTSQESLKPKGNLSPSMAVVESKLQGSKDRTIKSRRLLKRLPGPKPKGKQRTESTLSECTGCFDEVPDREAVDLPCRHKYCVPCFSQLVGSAIHSEATFPPKCCLSEVPKTTMRAHLPPKELAQFEGKALEYAVPIGNRYYCVSPKCARWIDTRTARRTNGALECPHCSTKLCTVCRGPQHPSNEDCPQDFGLESTLDRAELAGWRRCYNCRAMVELNTGCRHITCKCRAEFCYTCGARWRTCACTEADQARRQQEVAARLAQADADQRAEEEELRAAFAAVEAAERQLQEERQAEEERLEEEQRELTRREFERLEQIADHFEHLRRVLENVRLQQRQAIEERHSEEREDIDKLSDYLESPKTVAKRDQYVASERKTLIASTDSTIKVLQQNHASTIIEIITRHRKDQDDLLAMAIESPDQNPEVMKADILQEFMLAQELERKTLKAQQASEIQKWKARGEESLKAFDTKMMAQKMRLEEAEKINQRAMEMKKTAFADSKWFDAVFLDRTLMLAEDERRLILSGSEAPGVKPKEEVARRPREDTRTTWLHSVGQAK